MRPIQWICEVIEKTEPTIIIELRRYVTLLDSRPYDGEAIREVKALVRYYDEGRVSRPNLSVRASAIQLYHLARETDDYVTNCVAHDLLGMHLGYKCPARVGHYYREAENLGISFT